jgi:hypothetical protein
MPLDATPVVHNMHFSSLLWRTGMWEVVRSKIRNITILYAILKLCAIIYLITENLCRKGLRQLESEWHDSYPQYRRPVDAVSSTVSRTRILQFMHILGANSHAVGDSLNPQLLLNNRFNSIYVSWLYFIMRRTYRQLHDWRIWFSFLCGSLGFLWKRKRIRIAKELETHIMGINIEII